MQILPFCAIITISAMTAYWGTAAMYAKTSWYDTITISVIRRNINVTDCTILSKDFFSGYRG